MSESDDPSIFDFDPFDLARRLLEETNAVPTRPEDFGPYHFLDRPPLGRGALGDVWLAEEKGAERLVAVKFLRQVSHPEAAANEIKNQGKLEHKYIARLYNYGVPEDGTAWLAMEYVEGQPLDKYFEAQRPTIDQRLSLFHAICEAVQYAHSEKVDHGDLKPTNILVKNGGEPKLVDFGLARRLHEDSGSDSPVLGYTPAYAAPEQFRGTSSGFRSDVYSLGVILYELLAGETPFDASKHTLAEIENLKWSDQKSEPPSVLAKRAGADQALREAQWRELDAICQKAMERDLDQRYSSAEALLQDLDRYMRHEPLAARLPHSRGYRFATFARRNQRALIAASAAVILLTGMVAFFTFRLASERNNALAEAARTRRIQRFMLDLFGNRDQQAAPSKDLTVLAALDRGAANIQSLKSDPETQAELYLTLGRLYDQLNKFEKAGELLRLGLAKSKVIGGGTPRTVNAFVQLGLLQGDEAKVAEGEQSIRDGLKLAERLHLAAADPEYINAQSALGRVLVQKGEYAKAIAILEPIVQRPAAGEAGVINLTESLTALAVAQQYLGNYDKADALNRRALELDRSIHGNAHPRVAYDLANIATTLTTHAKYAEAENLYREAAGILEIWYSADHPETLQVRSFVALAAMQQGKNAEAEQLLKDVLPLQERAYGTPDHPNISLTHDLLGKLALKRGNAKDAEAEFRRSDEINKKLYGESDYKTAATSTDLAQALAVQGRFAEAEQVVRPAVKALTERPLKGNPTVATAQLTWGHALLKLGRAREAEQPLLASYDALKGLPIPQNAKAKDAANDLAAVYEELRQPDKAAEYRALVAAPRDQTK